MASPSATRALASSVTVPFTRTQPPAISRASRVRDSAAASGTSRESALSRRGGGAAAIRKDTGAEPMNDTPNEPPVDTGTVRYLRILVTVLTVTMILGFIVIVVLFVIRFSAAFGPELPDVITLPDGTVPVAFTRARDWYAVVTDDSRILIFDLDSGALRQEIAVE